jgi:hypothetical protein
MLTRFQCRDLHSIINSTPQLSLAGRFLHWYKICDPPSCVQETYGFVYFVMPPMFGLYGPQYLHIYIHPNKIGRFCNTEYLVNELKAAGFETESHYQGWLWFHRSLWEGESFPIDI